MTETKIDTKSLVAETQVNQSTLGNGYIMRSEAEQTNKVFRLLLDFVGNI